MSRSNFFRGGILSTLLTLLAPLAGHAVEPVNKTFLGGLAIEGYDAVSYFTDGKAVKGSKEYEHSWQGATWRFASAAHRDAFAADPGKYAPQYGGYCAYAVAQNTTASIDPQQWTVHQGKLYLNYDRKIQATWLEDMAGYIAKADQNWPRMVDKKSTRNRTRR